MRTMSTQMDKRQLSGTVTEASLLIRAKGRRQGLSLCSEERKLAPFGKRAITQDVYLKERIQMILRNSGDVILPAVAGTRRRGNSRDRQKGMVVEEKTPATHSVPTQAYPSTRKRTRCKMLLPVIARPRRGRGNPFSLWKRRIPTPVRAPARNDRMVSRILRHAQNKSSVPRNGTETNERRFRNEETQ